MTPDPSKTYFVSVSGGKDSTALWLYLERDLKLPNLVPIFADTKWEHKITIDYLRYLNSVMNAELRYVELEFGFADLCVKKKRFPSPRRRFCTEWLKLRPIRDFINHYMIDNNLEDHDVVMCCGVRREESHARRNFPEFEWDDFMQIPKWNPIVAWIWNQVFDLHDKYDIMPNPLYLLGMSRVGCMPCIMCNQKELRVIAERWPEIFEVIAIIEKILAGNSKQGFDAAFFDYRMVPDRFCSKVYVGKNGEKYKVPTAEDMFKYVLMNKDDRRAGLGQLKLFEDEKNEPLSCDSIYGLCE